MKTLIPSLNPLKFSPSIPHPLQISHKSPSFPLHFPPPIPLLSSPPKSHQTHITNPNPITQSHAFPLDSIKVLTDFKSNYNHIKVLEVSRREDHPFRGSRLLLLDEPGNIHSINFTHRLLTGSYFDVFGMIPPILRSGSIGVLGFGAGTTARLILELYSDVVVHGWEIDPHVIDVGREYFELSRLEMEFEDRLFVHVGDALDARVEGGFSGILVDLFSKGCLVPQLQDYVTWEKLKGRLIDGGRIMVNVGGSCVEAEGEGKDGRFLMEETLKAMEKVFGDQLYVLSLGNGKDDSSIALTGSLPDSDVWKEALYPPLRCYVDMWTPYRG